MLQNGSLCRTNGGKIFHVNKTTILMDFNLFFSVINLFTSAAGSTYRVKVIWSGSAIFSGAIRTVVP
jgi:hypothetical protein